MMENEVRLIDANALKQVVNADINRCYMLRIDGVGPLCKFIDDIEAAPTIDSEALRPKGRWIKHQEKRPFGKEYYTCSNCKSRNGLAIKFNYCFNCGAKMEA